MKILAIETSCDETAAAVVERMPDGTIELLSTVVASSLELHSQTGGIIPERAARKQIEYIIPVIYEALEKASTLPVPTQAGIQNKKQWDPDQVLRQVFDSEVVPTQGAQDKDDSEQRRTAWDDNFIPDIDALAITYGPGLIGSLLVGVETVKALSYIWRKPVIPVNHLFGHIYANWVRGKTFNPSLLTHILSPVPDFPAVALIVSGGHTDLLYMKSHTDITWLGGTRDDAAGEAFDKIGRLVGLAYPAGPKIEQLAKSGNQKTFHFPRPILHEGYDFSFSGLKTAVLREVEKLSDHVSAGMQDQNAVNLLSVSQSEKLKTDQPGPKVHQPLAKGSENRNQKTENRLESQTIADICRGVQDAIIDVLVHKTLKAAKEFQVTSIILGGGVAANETLRESFIVRCRPLEVKLFTPAKSLCTDNAVMIGAAAFFRNEEKPWEEITANPELYFD